MSLVAARTRPCNPINGIHEPRHSIDLSSIFFMEYMTPNVHLGTSSSTRTIISKATRTTNVFYYPPTINRPSPSPFLSFPLSLRLCLRPWTIFYWTHVGTRMPPWWCLSLLSLFYSKLWCGFTAHN
jgi:hypothetical protein